eukprot:4293609-Amphidinium_carterae.1
MSATHGDFPRQRCRCTCELYVTLASAFFHPATLGMSITTPKVPPRRLAARRSLVLWSDFRDLGSVWQST